MDANLWLQTNQTEHFVQGLSRLKYRPTPFFVFKRTKHTCHVTFHTGNLLTKNNCWTLDKPRLPYQRVTWGLCVWWQSCDVFLGVTVTVLERETSPFHCSCFPAYWTRYTAFYFKNQVICTVLLNYDIVTFFIGLTFSSACLHLITTTCGWFPHLCC